MFKDLTSEQIDKIAGGLMTTAHLSLGSLIFGQVSSDRPFNLILALLGFLLWVWLFLISAQIMQAGTRRKKRADSR